MGVTRSREDLKHSITNLEHRDIKGAASKVKNKDCFIVFLFKAIGQGCSGWFIDDTKNLKTSNPTGILGGSPLGVIEVSRHRNNGLGNLIVQKLGSIINKLPQNLYNIQFSTSCKGIINNQQ